MRKLVKGVLLLCVLSFLGCFPSKREAYVRDHAEELTASQKQNILDGKLYIGMPIEAVVAAIGRPTRVNADFLGHQVVWYYDYDRNFGTQSRNVFKTTFIVEFKDDRVYNWRED